MSWRLPESLKIGDSDFRIRTDYRDILTIFEAFNDPELSDDAKTYVMLKIIYPDADNIPDDDLQEAVDKAIDFINQGQDYGDNKKPKLMDWEQDEDILIPAINKVAGCEVRAVEHLHWWTFLGYYMEIGESLFSQVVNIRYKRSHGKKLEDWEKDFEKENRKLCRLEKKLTAEEQAQREAERKALEELI